MRDNQVVLPKLKIENFKSIENLELECGRINIFIGKPNSGKSNILEAIGLLSNCFYFQPQLKTFIRLENMSNLYHDLDLGKNIRVKYDDRSLEIKYRDGLFYGRAGEIELFKYSHDGSGNLHYLPLTEFSPFKFYRFAAKEIFHRMDSEFLYPPSGDNLLSVILTHKELRSLVSEIFREFGYHIALKPRENKIEIQKKMEEDIFVSFPYYLASETLQRTIFHIIAIESNKDSVIIFEEPEAHAFPYYTKFLAERISLDNRRNTFFISTHNPYFLLSILEKSSEKDVAVFVTYMKNYKTMTKRLSRDEIKNILEMESDVFFNLDQFLEGN